MAHDHEDPPTPPSRDAQARGGVMRLKELLFDSESQRLEHVQRRLEALDDRETERHVTLGRKVDAVFERAGSEDRMLKSVAHVIDGALREAEVTKHDQLSRAMAPLVVRTIKHELKHSQSEMVDALYPITGKLVKQYVQSAMTTLMDDINRKLGGSKPSDIEARARARGVTVAELVLAETQALKVDELFLVKRGSGELVAHWESGAPAPGDLTHASPGHNRDVLIAGYLSGITAFSEEAFDDKKGSLRSIDLDGERIFVRASPAYLLAARCSGSAPATVEQIIDEEFLSALTSYRETLTAEDGADPAAAKGQRDALLPELAATFERRFAEQRAAVEASAAAQPRRSRLTRLRLLAAMVLLPLIAWAGWSAFASYQTGRTRMAALEVLGGQTALSGYPVQIDVPAGGRVVVVSGLAPSVEAKDGLTRSLTQEVGWAEIRNGLTVLPAAPAARDYTPELGAVRRDVSELAVSPVRRALERAGVRLAELRRALPTLAGVAGPARIDEINGLLGAAEADAGRLRTALEQTGDARARMADLAALDRRLLEAEARLAAIGGSGARPPRGATPGDPAVLAEEIAITAERMAGLVPLLERTQLIAPLQTAVADLRRRLETLKLPDAPGPRQALLEFVRDNAVFFLNGTDLADPAETGLMLQRLVALANDAGASLRVVGYTDERAATTVVNPALSVARAERVAQLLVDRGLPRERLSVIGRPTGPDIARTTGPGTPNRRVEFEVAFLNEPVGR